MRYFLVDRIDELRKFSYAIARRCISLSEDCFEHHFPGQPVYPGSLLIESMAQLGGALLELSMRDELTPCPRCAMSSVKAKLREFVRPGDALIMRADVISHHEQSALVNVVCTRDGLRVCQADILYVYVTVNDARLQASREEFLDVITRATRYLP